MAISSIINGVGATPGTGSFNICDASSGNVVRALPPLDAVRGNGLLYVRVDASSNSVRISPCEPNGVTIEGWSSITIDNQYDQMEFIAPPTGNAWIVRETSATSENTAANAGFDSRIVGEQRRQAICLGPVPNSVWAAANTNPANWLTDGPIWRVPWPYLKDSGQLHWSIGGDYVNAGISDFINFDLDVDLAQAAGSATSVGLFTGNGARSGGATSTGGTGFFRLEATLQVQGDIAGAPKHELAAKLYTYTAANVLISEVDTRARYAIDATNERILRWIYRIQSTAANGTSIYVRSWNAWWDARRSG